MASAPGIVLAATGVSFTNDWYNHPRLLPNFRILAAGGVFSLFIAVIADVNEGAAKGLATIMFITVLATPTPHGNAPLQTLASLSIAKPKG